MSLLAYMQTGPQLLKMICHAHHEKCVSALRLGVSAEECPVSCLKLEVSAQAHCMRKVEAFWAARGM